MQDFTKIKDGIYKALQPFLFDGKTQDILLNIESAVKDELTNNKVYGLYDFCVICDLGNNNLEDNDLIIDVAIKENEDSEFIYIPFKLTPTGGYQNV